MSWFDENLPAEAQQPQDTRTAGFVPAVASSTATKAGTSWFDQNLPPDALQAPGETSGIPLGARLGKIVSDVGRTLKEVPGAAVEALAHAPTPGQPLGNPAGYAARAGRDIMAMREGNPQAGARVSARALLAGVPAAMADVATGGTLGVFPAAALSGTMAGGAGAAVSGEPVGTNAALGAAAGPALAGLATIAPRVLPAAGRYIAGALAPAKTEFPILPGDVFSTVYKLRDLVDQTPAGATFKGVTSIRPVVKNLSPDDISSMMDYLQSGSVPENTAGLAMSGLKKVLKARKPVVPTSQEMNAMADALGPDLSASLWEKKPLAHKVGAAIGEGSNFARTISTAYDVSAAGKQAMWLATTYPKEFTRAFGSQLKALGNPEYYNQRMNYFHNVWDNREIARDAGLYLSNVKEPDVVPREEAFQSRLAEKIPGVLGSERAYTMMLNEIRTDAFDKLISQSPNVGVNKALFAHDAADIADFINNATGRGKLGKIGDRSAVLLAHALWSPRFQASRIRLMSQVLDPKFWTEYSPVARQAALKALVANGVALSTMLGLAAAGGAKVATDFRDPKWGKIPIGNTYYDVGGGMLPWMRLGAAMAFGPEAAGKSRKDVLETFARSKASPPVSFWWDVLSGKDYRGQPVTIHGALYNHLFPMAEQDMVQAVQDYNSPAGAVLALPSIAGVGVQTYKPKPGEAP